MRKIKLIIISEGNKKSGFGHITRCLAIGQAFEERGISPKYIINGDRTILDILKDKDYKIIDWLKACDRLSGLVKGADIAIVDSYLATAPLYKLICRQCGLLVSYDDNNRLSYPEGVVINGALYAESLDYPSQPRVTYLLGNAYQPLRKHFWRICRKLIRKKVKNILVTFGGDDLRDMTPKVTDLLARKYPEVAKNVVIGRAFRSVAAYKHKKSFNTNFVLFPDARKMRELMQQADLAVSAAGQTLYELAATGTPTVGVAIIKNQDQNLRACSAAGFTVSAGWYSDRQILEKLDFSVRQLLPYNARNAASRMGRVVLDGQGSRRIANKLLEISNDKN